jgi:hypothetical protein
MDFDINECSLELAIYTANKEITFANLMWLEHIDVIKDKILHLPFGDFQENGAGKAVDSQSKWISFIGHFLNAKTELRVVYIDNEEKAFTEIQIIFQEYSVFEKLYHTLNNKYGLYNKNDNHKYYWCRNGYFVIELSEERVIYKSIYRYIFNEKENKAQTEWL